METQGESDLDRRYDSVSLLNALHQSGHNTTDPGRFVQGHTNHKSRQCFFVIEERDTKDSGCNLSSRGEFVLNEFVDYTGCFANSFACRQHYDTPRILGGIYVLVGNDAIQVGTLDS